MFVLLIIGKMSESPIEKSQLQAPKTRVVAS